MEQYVDCSLCSIEPKGKAARCRRCSGLLTGRERLMHEIREARGWKYIATMLSAIAPGLGQFFGSRLFTGIIFGTLIPLGLGLLYVTWGGFSYSHFFVIGAAVFVLIVASADAWFGPTSPKAPCQKACPASLPIPDYLQLIANQDLEQGYSLIRTRLPLVGTIGRICPHPCEDRCFRGIDGEPISINGCKRYLADMRAMRLEKGYEPPSPPPALDDGPKVAIIGAGPAGLSCAYYLSVLGAKVEVFDADEEPGGRLISTIPDFRLPKDIIREEIEDLKARGVTFRSGERVGPGGTSVGRVFDEFDATFLSIGAPASIKLGIEGEEAFTDFQEFLRASKSDKPPKINGNVAIVGGGNAAVDAARTALRCGAKQVHLLYRRDRDQMPARTDELEAAMREGIKVHFLINPTRAILEDGVLKGLEVVDMQLGVIDRSGRPKPVKREGSERVMPFELVIPCLGQTVSSTIFDDPALARLTRHKDGRVRASTSTLRTSISGLYAGGDTVRGALTAVAAIADGRKAALAIFADIAPRKVRAPLRQQVMVREPYGGHQENAKAKMRERMHSKPLSIRISGFQEVEEGFNHAQASTEASRCLQCHRDL